MTYKEARLPRLYLQQSVRKSFSLLAYSGAECVLFKTLQPRASWRLIIQNSHFKEEQYLKGQVAENLPVFNDRCCQKHYRSLVLIFRYPIQKVRRRKNTFRQIKLCYYYYYYYYWYSVLGPVRAETRVQSGDWYDSGTLHPGQVLRGSLPLLSPAFFRRSHFSPPGASTSATTWEIPAAEGGTVGENVVR